MTRSPIAIVLVLISAVLIVSGRVNRESDWGNWVLLAGFAVLVLAGGLALRRKR